MPGTKELADRTAIAVCLALFLAVGLGDILREDFPVSTWPWIGTFVYGLMLGVPLLAITFRTVANLGAVRLMVLTGAAILLAHYVLDYLYGINYGSTWYGMYIRLRLGMFSEPPGWSSLEEVIGDWIGSWGQYLGWVRLLTFAGLGSIVAKHKELLPGIFVLISVALADRILGWLVYLPDDSYFETPALSFVLEYDLPALLRAVAIQTSISVCVGLVGVAFGRSDRLSRPVMPVARQRIYTVRRVPRHSR
ncbi:MAG TPA: hypothetical protein VF914_21215 [Chloroflexia bacterium]